MSSIKELIMKKFRKNQTRGSIFCELQCFNVIRDFVYQALKRYKDRLHRKTQILNLKTASLHSSSHQQHASVLSMNTIAPARIMATALKATRGTVWLVIKITNKTKAKHLERSKILLRWQTRNDIIFF
jgi:hypothetical protein